jgi:SAM-dependent methyltransferase
VWDQAALGTRAPQPRELADPARGAGRARGRDGGWLITLTVTGFHLADAAVVTLSRVASLTDRDVLVGHAYAGPGPLEARKAIYRWQRPARDLPGMALSFLQGVTGLVVDVGCGSGEYLHRLADDRPGLRVLGLDLSPGMRPPVVADAQRLPLPDGAAGAVLAMHMLYHVPDIGQAAAELARVLRPDGVAIAATNGADHMRQFAQLFASAVHAVSPGAVTAGPASVPVASHRFRLENAPATLRQHFASAEAVSWRAEIRVPDAAPVVAYLDSTRAGREDLLPAGVSWPAVMSAARELAGQVIARDGAFPVHSHSGLIVCRGPRRAPVGPGQRSLP